MISFVSSNTETITPTDENHMKKKKQTSENELQICILGQRIKSGGTDNEKIWSDIQSDENFQVAVSGYILDSKST